MAEKKTSAVVYVLVWLGLCGLTMASFLLSRLNLGTMDTVLSLVIAVIKSTLVGLFFMHLLEERLRSAFVPVIATGFTLLLVLLVVTDVLTRHTFPRTPLPAEVPGGLEPPGAAGPTR